MHDLPQRIRFFREKHEWSLRELAGRLGISHGAVNAWELGRSAPNMDRLAQLVEVFGTTLPLFFKTNITSKKRRAS